MLLVKWRDRSGLAVGHAASRMFFTVRSTARPAWLPKTWETKLFAALMRFPTVNQFMCSLRRSRRPSVTLTQMQSWTQRADTMCPVVAPASLPSCTISLLRMWRTEWRFVSVHGHVFYRHNKPSFVAALSGWAFVLQASERARCPVFDSCRCFHQQTVPPPSQGGVKASVRMRSLEVWSQKCVVSNGDWSFRWNSGCSKLSLKWLFVFF